MGGYYAGTTLVHVEANDGSDCLLADGRVVPAFMVYLKPLEVKIRVVHDSVIGGTAKNVTFADVDAF